jgi:flagellin FlaB
MVSKFRAMMRGEAGITALETAIILIAFVVVASVFAFTILSAGIFTTERGKEAVYAGLSEVRGTMEMKGSVIAEGSAAGGVVSQCTFTVANVAGGEPIDMSTGTDQKISIDYRDSQHIHSNVPISITFTGYSDGDNLLEAGELAQIIVPLNGQTIAGLSTAGVDVDLGANTQFSLEIKPPKGAVILLQRTTPAYIDLVMDLH